VNKYLTATSPSYVAVRQDETKSLLLPLWKEPVWKEPAIVPPARGVAEGGGAIPKTDLRPTVLAHLTKPTVQSNLRDHVIIENIEHNVAHLVVTNKIAEMLLQNAETKKELENALSSQLWTPTTISFTFESKEDYFTRTLGM
jgi:hypothetical protein